MDKPNKSRKRRWIIAALLIIFGVVFWAQQRWLHDLRALEIGGAPTDVARGAQWPWHAARMDAPARGVRHWRDDSAGDGTVCELIEFDFKANPKLRFRLFDQDSDDGKPWDNHRYYWKRGAAQMTRELNGAQGCVVALWNGPFFGYHGGSKWASGAAFHVSPVVVNGQLHDWGANHRWSFGVKTVGGAPRFATFHQPNAQTLIANYDYASGGLQCLIRDGKPLQIRAYGLPALPQPVASTPLEIGHIPDFDWMKSSRTSIAWSRDSSKMWLLFVKEGDSESASISALRMGGGALGLQLKGGWSVDDVQRFWQSKGVWGAINSDAGDVAQLSLMRRDGRYDVVPSRQDSSQMRVTFDGKFKGAPDGGALMYFYVVERAS